MFQFFAVIKTARKQKLRHDKQVRLDTWFNWRQPAVQTVECVKHITQLIY